MFHLIFSLPWLVVVIRFIQPLPWLWSLKACVAIMLLVGSQYHLFSRFSSGSVFSPEFPRPIVIMFNVFFGAILLIAVFQIALDLLSLLIMLVRGRFPMAPAGVRYGIGILAFCLAALGVNQAIRVPPLKDVQLTIPGLPAAFDGYQLIQLTDLHISRLFPTRWVEQVVARTNALDADLIVITGDLIDGSIKDRMTDVSPLAGLRARDGVFAIPGNHEYFFGYEDWMRYFAGLNMYTLANSHAVIKRNESQIVIAGVTDLSAVETGSPAPDLKLAIKDIPDPAAPIILLDHQPKNARQNAELGIAVQLSGHAHGGMITGLHRIIAFANGGFVSGMYQVGGMQLYVNNGTALWPGFALRLGRPSELTRITLRRGL